MFLWKFKFKLFERAGEITVDDDTLTNELFTLKQLVGQLIYKFSHGNQICTETLKIANMLLQRL